MYEKEKNVKENHLRKGMVLYIAIVNEHHRDRAAFAASDPLSVIDNLSTFIFGLIGR